MGKTRHLVKKIRDTKGTFHAKMGSIKDRNAMDLTEAEDIKKRWQVYTEELYKKHLHPGMSQDAGSLQSSGWFQRRARPATWGYSFHPRGSCHAWHSLPFQPGLPFSPVGPSAPLLAAPEKRSCWQGPHTDACLPVSLPPSSWSRTITCPGPVAAAAPVRGLIPRPACQQPPRSARGSLQPLPARGSRPCPQPSSPSRPGSPPV